MIQVTVLVDSKQQNCGIQADMEEESGIFCFRFTQEADAKAALLLNSLIFGLLDIQEEYGEPYITICYKEV